MKKHRSLTGFAVAFVTIAIAACSGSAASPAISPTAIATTSGSSSAPVTPSAPSAAAVSGTLNIVTNAGGNSDLIAALIPAFNAKYPDVKVVQNAIDPQTLQTTAAQLYASSDAPDVGFLQPSAASWQTLLDAHGLAPLNDVWAAAGLPTALAPNVIKNWTAKDGNNYGVPYQQVWTPVIYYNKKMFQDAGITEPTNHRLASSDELYTIVDKLKAAKHDGLAVGGGEFPSEHVIFGLMEGVATPSDPYENYLTNWQPGSTTPANYSTGTYLAAVTKVKEWNDHGVFAKGTPTMTWMQSTSLFTAGGAGMVSDGSWTAVTVQKANLSFEVGWFLYPGATTRFQTFVNDGEVMPASAKNPAAAKAFLTWFASPEAQGLSAKLGVPLRNDIPQSALSGLDPITLEMLNSQKTLGAIDGWSPDPSMIEVSNKGFPQILIGEKTPQQVADTMQAAADAIRKK